MSREAAFQAEVIAQAHELGLLVHHSTDPTRDIGPGFPDLFIAGPRGFILAELKVPGGRMRPDQTTWAWRLRAAGAPYAVWMPGDWLGITSILCELSSEGK